LRKVKTMKASLPLLLLGGGALLLTSGKKKKTRSSSGGTGGGGTGGGGTGGGGTSGGGGTGGGRSPEIVKSGEMQDGWKYRVRKVKAVGGEGFASKFFGEICAPHSNFWTKAHQDPRNDAESARLLAMEAIAVKISQLAEGANPDGKDVHSYGECFYSDNTPSGWMWRVIQMPDGESVGGSTVPMVYMGQYKDQTGTFMPAHEGSLKNPEDARNMAMDACAKSLMELGKG